MLVSVPFPKQLLVKNSCKGLKYLGIVFSVDLPRQVLVKINCYKGLKIFEYCFLSNYQGRCWLEIVVVLV